MSTFKDFFTNYAIFLGRRFYPKEKLKFLALAQKELENANYPVNITQSEEKIVGEKILYHNLYAGDFKKAKVVFATYYDTPKKSIFPAKPVAFNTTISKTDAIDTLLLPVSVIILTILLFYFVLMPGLAADGFFSAAGLLSLVLFIFALMITRKFRYGIPKRNNIIRNSSSIVSLLLYASQKRNQEPVAFAFIDSGTTNDYGLVMLEDYLKGSKAKVVMLDSVGGEDELHLFANGKLKINQPGVQLHKKAGSFPQMGDVFLTSGDLVDHQVVIKENEATSDIEQLELRYQKVMQVLNQVVISLR